VENDSPRRPFLAPDITRVAMAKRRLKLVEKSSQGYIAGMALFACEERMQAAVAQWHEQHATGCDLLAQFAQGLGALSFLQLPHIIAR
jgi:hypothetical protein